MILVTGAAGFAGSRIITRHDEQGEKPRALVRSSAQSHDEDLQRRLWTVSEELTGVRFGV